MVFPTLDFPSDHAAISMVLRTKRGNEELRGAAWHQKLLVVLLLDSCLSMVQNSPAARAIGRRSACFACSRARHLYKSEEQCIKIHSWCQSINHLRSAWNFAQLH